MEELTVLHQDRTQARGRLEGKLPNYTLRAHSKPAENPRIGIEK
jgi:hypothetical protein